MMGTQDVKPPKRRGRETCRPPATKTSSSFGEGDRPQPSHQSGYTSCGLSISVEGALVLMALAGLTLLDLAAGTPWIQKLPNTRLAYATLLVLPLFLAPILVLRRWERLGRTLGDWWPIVGTLAVYESLKHLHANRITEAMGIPPLDKVVLRADQILFGKALPLYFDRWSSHWFIDLMWFFYFWVYYFGPVLLLGWVYFVELDDRAFTHLRRGLVSVLLGGYVLYLLVPVAGPLFLIGDKFTHPIRTHPVLGNLVFSTLRYNWDCFPSLHTAVPWLLTAVAWPRVRRWLRIVCVVCSAGVTLSTVVLRAHYGIDLVAGLLWAALIFALVRSTTHGAWRLMLPWTQPLSPKRSTRIRAAALLGLFTVSGFVALIVEQAFEKLLQPLVGTTGHSAAVVLATYFLGLTIGGALYGRWFESRISRPFRLYGILEGGVALYALLLYLGYDHLVSLFAPLLALLGESSVSLTLGRLVVTACWVLPVTIVMGATFPAVAQAVEMGVRSRAPARLMAVAYGVNIVGAFAAAFVTPYWIFPYWGVDGSLLVAFALDLLVFLGALSLDQSIGGTERVAHGARRRDPFPFRYFLEQRRMVVLVLAFLTGFIFFSLEVLWNHLIATVVGASVYSFSLMLALVLLGLGVSGVLVGLVSRASPHLSLATPGALLLGGGVILAWTHGSWPHVPHSLAVWGGSLETFAQAELLRWFRVFPLIVLAAMVLGMVFPSLFRLRAFPESHRGSAAGKLVASNATGCILGALITSFLLIPYLGSEAVSAILMWACVGSGVIVLAMVSETEKRRRLLMVGLAAVLFLATRPSWDHLQLTSGEQVYFGRHQVFPQSRLLFSHEDITGGMTTVVWNPAGVKGQDQEFLTLLTNGKFQGNDSWERDAQVGFATVPAMFCGGFDRALVIGLGTGQSARVVRETGFAEIDIAEIAPGILEAAREYFPHVNGRVLDAPNVHIHLKDGRNYLLLHDRRYDLITMEISSVWFAGATNLYSREFYELASRRLADGGVLQQWIQLHHISPREIDSSLATVQSVFPYVSLWVVGGQGIVVATHRPQVVSAAFFRRFPRLASVLDKELDGDAGFSWFRQLLASQLLAPPEVRQLVLDETPVLNTDRNRLLEYWTPRYNITKVDWVRVNLRRLSRWAHNLPVPMDANIPERWRRGNGGLEIDD